MTASPISLLIVGVGSIGERHLRCFQQTGRVEAAICETNPDLRRQIADRYHVERVYGDLDAALAAGADAAVIATPASTHMPISIKAAQLSVHLLIEKPLSTSFECMDLLSRICSERRIIAAVAYVMRNHPALIAGREAVLSGEFGKPLQVVVVSGQNFPFYRPGYRDTYYARRCSGGGAIQDALTHFVNAVEWIVGPVHQVVADASHLAIPGVEVEDTVHVLARHGKVMAAYTLNQHQAPNESTITIVCEQGVVRISLTDNQWSTLRQTGDSWTVHRLPDLQRDDLFVSQAVRFLDAIEGKAPVPCNLAEGAATLGANLAILQSADSPAWESVQSLRCDG